MAKRSISTYLFFGVPVIIVLFIGFAVYAHFAPSPYEGFARCLTEKGTTMYGTWWCPHCQNQKDAFGKAFQFVRYVECSPDHTRTASAQCVADGIKGFPTWKSADGSDLSGEVPLNVLSEKTGCELPK